MLKKWPRGLPAQLRTLLFFVFFFSPTHAVPLEASVAVSSAQGTVEVLRNGKWMAANPQTVFREGDLIKTGKEGQVDISLNGKAGIRMTAGTELALQKLAANQTRFELKVGNIIANVKKYENDSKFEVETPVVVLAVRGTQFWGRVDRTGALPATTFAVREGIVNCQVKESEEIFTLEEGRALDIPPDDSRPVVRDAYEEEMEALEAAEDIVIHLEENEIERPGTAGTENKD